MRKLTAKHKIAIANLMLKTTADYINAYCVNNSDTDNVDMYCADVAHNISALDVFNKTNNVMQLHDNIMLQDTLVREEYINVLRYIEQNNLINADCFVCI